MFFLRLGSVGVVGGGPAPPKAGAGLLSISAVGVRHGFIKKVFGILGAQLAITTLLGGAVMRMGESAVRASPDAVLFVLFASLAITIVLPFVFTFWPGSMRSYPANYIMLGLFTLAESVMVGFVCRQYTEESVLLVLGITCLAVVGLTAFAFQTRYDFTSFGPYLCCACLVLLGFSLSLLVVSMCGLRGPAFEVAHICYSALVALLFSMYIVYDTQMIMVGKHTHQMSVDDYAMAAITLYLDIIQLFLQLLKLLGEPKEKKKKD